MNSIKRVQLILGKDFFYENESPKIRATHGMIFYKEMKLDEFLVQARELEKSMEERFCTVSYRRKYFSAFFLNAGISLVHNSESILPATWLRNSS